MGSIEDETGELLDWRGRKAGDGDCSDRPAASTSGNTCEGWPGLGVDDTVPDTVDDQPDAYPTSTADQVARYRALEQEATYLAADPADRAQIAELRSLLGEPWADLPA